MCRHPRLGGRGAAPRDAFATRRFDVSLVDEPARRAFDGFLRGPGVVAELFAGSRVVEGHLGRRHPGRFEGDRRMAPEQAPFDEFGKTGDPERHGAGHPQLRFGKTGEPGEDGEQALEGVVLAAQDVTAPDAAALEREHVPEGDVVDVRDVERRIDVPGHPSVEVVEDEPTRGRGRPVVGPEGERRHDDRRRQPLRCGAQHLVLGDVLRPLVRPEQMADIRIVAFMGGATVVRGLEPQGPDGARVHDLVDLGGASGLDDVERAAHVHLVEKAGVARPEAVQRGHMEHGPAVAHSAPHPIGVADIRLDPLDVEALEVGVVGSRLEHGHHLSAPADESSHDSRPDEAAGPGDEDAVGRAEVHVGSVLILRRHGETGGDQVGVRRRAPFAMVLPNSQNRPEPRPASVRTSSSASTKYSTSSSPATSGGRSLTTLTLSAATWVRMRWRWKSGTTTICENSAGRIASRARHRIRIERDSGGPNTSPIMRPLPRTSCRNSCFSTNGSSALAKASPVRRARSTMSSSSNACNVARPATIASWFMLNVDECTTARSIELKTLSNTLAEDSIAPTGT